MSTLKEQKEAFVTGLTGTNTREITLVCIAPIFSGLLLYHEMRHFYLSRKKNSHVVKWDKTLVKNCGVESPNAVLISFEALVILFPVALCQTKFLYPWGVYFICGELALGLVLHAYSQQRKTFASPIMNQSLSRQSIIDNENKNMPFLTCYRSTVSYLTFVAILAVDFHVFPRRFAKTETTGYGLMDLGAGSFVVSGGLVSWFSRRQMGQQKPSSKSRFKYLIAVLKRSAPLVIIGLIRLMTTKGLEYQEHVSEYGTHWNFYFTLTFIGILSTLIRLVPYFDNLLFPATLLGLYQYLLSNLKMQDFIEQSPRVCHFDVQMEQPILLYCNFIFANREGIMGCIGYLCIHLFSENLGRYCLWYSSSSGQSNSLSDAHTPNLVKKQFQSKRDIRLVMTSGCLWICHLFLTEFLQIPVSRRSTNASFVFWTLAHNMTALTFIWFTFQIAAMVQTAPKPHSPQIFAAVNRCGLLIFIAANLLTGVINLTTNTMDTSDTVAVLVIMIYLCTIGVLALFIDFFVHGQNTKVIEKIN
mmetsp:Transcript_1734/g.2493  ORF Transcript_1734/g.2493 Transcript_1734/m.2493 type:complete len:529 (-) Transcript_1734:27-1613(-)